MKKYLIVETDYEYNDEYYGQNEGYTIRSNVFLNKAEAEAEANRRNDLSAQDKYFTDYEDQPIRPFSVVAIEEESTVPTEPIKTLTDLQAEAELLKTTISASLATEISKLLQSEPRISAISWRQYTPYFNDGDECVFRSTYDYLDIYDAQGEELFYSSRNPYPVVDKIISLINEFFDDDQLKDLFGDHVQVKISSDGKLTVSEYEHA